MAKLKGPLFSLGASAQIGKAIVYFPWKGLNCAREYVIPSNPNSGPQQTQRGYVTAAVAKIHFCQGIAGILFGADDQTSYSLLGSLQATPRTWFNTVVKQWIDQKRLTLIPAVWSKGSITHADGAATLTLTIVPESGGPTDLKVVYGTSKSNMPYSSATTPAALEAGKTITGLTNGTKYYFQVKPTAGATFLGTNSGIWTTIPHA